MLQLPEPDWRPGSPGSSSTSQTQCVSCGDIPTPSPLGLRILVLAGKLIQLSGPVLGHHISSGQGLSMMGQMPGQQAPIHFSPGPQCHGLQRHVGTFAPALLICAGPSMGTHQAALFGRHIGAHGCWESGTGSGSCVGWAGCCTWKRPGQNQEKNKTGFHSCAC